MSEHECRAFIAAANALATADRVEAERELVRIRTSAHARGIARDVLSRGDSSVSLDAAFHASVMSRARGRRDGARMRR